MARFNGLMILAIDIGGTSTKLALVEDGIVVVRDRMDTRGDHDEHAYVERLVDHAQRSARRHGATISAIGIGAPNGNHLTGTIENAPNMPWKHDVPLARLVSERMNVPTFLGNDANAAALGEWKYGAGRGYRHLLVVTLGTGVGSGSIVNGELLLGAAGNAGELGHMIIVPDGRPCTCGRNGCLEAYVSIRGMWTSHEELMTAAGRKGSPMEITDMAEAARNGDQEALHVFDQSARWLAIGLANAVCATGPARIVLFGGLSRNSDILMPRLMTHFEDYLLTIYKGRVDIVTSELPGDDAALLGAAALAIVGASSSG